MKVKNGKEIDSWVFQHAQIQGHECVGIKVYKDGDYVNVAYVDSSTGERIDIEYETDEDEPVKTTS